MSSNIGRIGLYTEFWGWQARVRVLWERVHDGWYEVVLEILEAEEAMRKKYDKKLDKGLSERQLLASKCLASSAKTWEIAYEDKAVA